MGYPDEQIRAAVAAGIDLSNLEVAIAYIADVLPAETPPPRTSQRTDQPRSEGTLRASSPPLSLDGLVMEHASNPLHGGGGNPLTRLGKTLPAEE